MQLSYRADIDGLRAIAVLTVVGTHAGLLIEGGFVGVDVFFVISGFLITKIIHNELGTGRFSIWEFYKRRALRILPALYAMILAVISLGFFVLWPIEIISLSGSAISALASVSNIYFWFTEGYFTEGAKSAPLLHTWSLGVEEQFYLFFPVLMIFIARFWKNKIFVVVAALCAVSFIFSILQVHFDTRSAFYLLPARAWELGVGALVALRYDRFRPGPVASQIAAGLGLLLICISCIAYNPRTPFPGLAALPPVLGAALILWSGAGERTGPFQRLLSLPPATFMGKISYSLYLWHWPVLVLLGPMVEFGGAGRLGLVFLSIGLATLSWWFVERPFRRLTPSAKSRTVLAWSLAGGLALAIPATMALATNGFESRLTGQQAKLQTFIKFDTSVYSYGRCFVGREHPNGQYDSENCLSGHSPVILVGDSFAAHLRPGLLDYYPNMRQAAASGCWPLVNQYQEGASECAKVIGRVLSESTLDGVTTIIVSARWRDSALPDIRATAEFLGSRYPHVIIIGPLPEYHAPLARLLLRETATNIPVGEPESLASTRKLDQAFQAALQGMPGVTYVSALDVICDQDRCLQTVGDEPVQWDYGHLTVAGSKLVAARIAEISR